MVGWYCLPDKGYRPTRPKPPSYPPWGKIDYVLSLRFLIASARFFTLHSSLFTFHYRKGNSHSSLVLSSRQPFLVLALIPRLRPGLLSLRSVLPSRQRLSVRFVESVIEWKALRSCVFFRTRIYRIDTDVCCLSANPLDLLIRWILALPHPSLEWLFFGYG